MSLHRELTRGVVRAWEAANPDVYMGPEARDDLEVRIERAVGAAEGRAVDTLEGLRAYVEQASPVEARGRAMHGVRERLSWALRDRP